MVVLPWVDWIEGCLSTIGIAGCERSAYRMGASPEMNIDGILKKNKLTEMFEATPE